MNMSGFRRETPSCFESDEQYIKWLDLEFITSGGRHRLSVCEDCTPEFAKVMRGEGRCDHPEIQFNSQGLPLVGAPVSGYRGVSWHKKSKRWIARKTFGKAQIHLGYFDDPQSAAAGNTCRGFTSTTLSR